MSRSRRPPPSQCCENMGCNQSVEVVPAGGSNPKGGQNVEASTEDHHEPQHYRNHPLQLHQADDEEDESSCLIRTGDVSGSDQDLFHDDYTKDYSIVKKVTAGKNALSSIYMVLKRSNGEERHSDDKVFVLQVINMKYVAPERRKSMRKEIHSLKTIHHPNSTCSCILVPDASLLNLSFSLSSIYKIIAPSFDSSQSA
jgi:hypothetical protein